MCRNRRHIEAERGKGSVRIRDWWDAVWKTEGGEDMEKPTEPARQESNKAKEVGLQG